MQKHVSQGVLFMDHALNQKPPMFTNRALVTLGCFGISAVKSLMDKLYLSIGNNLNLPVAY